MRKIRLHGSSSGYTEIAPVAASGNNTLTLPNDGTIISKDANGAVGVTSITVGTGVTIGDGKITCDGSALTSINAAQLVGVCTSGLTKTGGFGKLVQVVSTTKTDVVSYSNATETYWNYTDFKVTLTPTSASNKILIMAVVMVGVDSQQSMYGQLRKNGSIITGANADAGSGASQGRSTVHHSYSTSAEAPLPVIINYLDTAGDTNERYYNLALSHTSGSTRTMYLNRGSSDSNNYYMGRSTSTITAIEIAA